MAPWQCRRQWRAVAGLGNTGVTGVLSLTITATLAVSFVAGPLASLRCPVFIMHCVWKVVFAAHVLCSVFADQLFWDSCHAALTSALVAASLVCPAVRGVDWHGHRHSQLDW